MQPLVAPLYGGKSAHELLAAMSDRPERSAYDIVREYWSQRSGFSRTVQSEEFEATWRRWLHDGVVPDTAFAPRTVTVSAAAAASGFPAAAAAGAGLEISFKNDPSVLDGRFANNGWLQELPKPITKLTWDNAVMVSPATAQRLNAGATPRHSRAASSPVSDVVEIRHRGRVVRGPLFPVVGHPDDCATVHLGYGRTPRRTPGQRRRLQRPRDPDGRRAVVRQRRGDRRNRPVSSRSPAPSSTT